MRRIAFPFLVAVSLLAVAAAATRSHYGGTLRIMMQSSGNQLGVPASGSPEEYLDAEHTISLVGDNLVRITPQGRPEAALATAWQSDSAGRSWQFTMRRGVRFHDGSELTPGSVMQVLQPLHPDWKLRAIGEILVVEAETASPNLLAELALPRDAIVKRNSDGILIGTGPFRIADWQPGQALKLVANEDCWSGRPFLDAVEIQFAKSSRDQAVALELGRTDLVESSAISASSQRARTSLPIELLALVFPANSRVQDIHIRGALALAIDRKPIQSVLLKGAGESTGSVLPNWMTGYSGVFSAQADLQRAKARLAGSRTQQFTLSYDPRDPQAQLIAERIALNAREAGLSLQVSLSGQADVSLLRIVLPSPDPATSLREAARQLALPQPAIHGNSITDLYEAERTLLEGNVVIPLFHLPITAAASARVHDWEPDLLGNWNTQDAWLEPNSP